MTAREHDPALVEMRNALWLGLKGVEGPTVHPSRLDEFERAVARAERERVLAEVQSEHWLALHGARIRELTDRAERAEAELAIRTEALADMTRIALKRKARVDAAEAETARLRGGEGQ